MTNFMNLEEGMADEDWDKCFLYNCKSHLWLFHAAKDELAKTDGAFITTASLSGVKIGGSSLPCMFSFVRQRVALTLCQTWSLKPP